MSRTDTMAQLLRLARLARRSEQTGQGPDEAVEQDRQDRLANESRRDFAKSALAATAAAAVWTMAPGAWAGTGRIGLKPTAPLMATGDIAVVGAGLAGLATAYELARLGIHARVFEAADRIGGRCASLRDVFPGQVVERGGEFISTSHHALLGYARGLGLELEDGSKAPGDEYYFFGGRRYSEAQVLGEYRAFADSIRQDLGVLGSPTADRFSTSDAVFDDMSIDDYLTLHGAGPLLRGLISSAYLAEYGAGIDALSSISFLRFVHGDRRSQLAPFGEGTGGHLRVVGGNDRIATGLASHLRTPVSLGHRLVAIRKLSDGRLRLVFDVDGRTVQNDHHMVVMTLPFTVLRDVELHPSLQLPAWKSLAIRSAGMGDHSKLMVGFTTPYWREHHGLNGTGFSDRGNLQSTWEANPANAPGAGAVLAGHFGGTRARAMLASTTQADALAFVANLDQALPGASAAVARDANGGLLAHTENWSHNPLSKGSLSCNRPGYFTTVANNEAKAVDNLLFAGEHTSSFYEWQGFMEGAALSGMRAAGEIAALVRT